MDDIYFSPPRAQTPPARARRPPPRAPRDDRVMLSEHQITAPYDDHDEDNMLNTIRAPDQSSDSDVSSRASYTYDEQRITPSEQGDAREENVSIGHYTDDDEGGLEQDVLSQAYHPRPGSGLNDVDGVSEYAEIHRAPTPTSSTSHGSPTLSDIETQMVGMSIRAPPDVEEAVHKAIRNGRRRKKNRTPADSDPDVDPHTHEPAGIMNSGLLDALDNPDERDEEVRRAVLELAEEFPELLITNEKELRKLDREYANRGGFNHKVKSHLSGIQLISLALYQIKLRGNVPRAIHCNYVSLVACLLPRGKPHDARTVEGILERVTGIGHVSYDICVNGCVCFYGKYELLRQCPNPHCKDKERYDHKGRPRAQFDYIPLRHQIRLWWGHPETAKMLRSYRATLENAPPPDEDDPGSKSIRDVWEAKLFEILRETKGILTNPTDLAFYFSTDGVSLFRNGAPHQVWPLIVTCFNWPPDVRFNEDKVLCLGTYLTTTHIMTNVQVNIYRRVPPA